MIDVSLLWKGFKNLNGGNVFIVKKIIGTDVFFLFIQEQEWNLLLNSQKQTTILAQ